ncbi:MAG: right-handed parallel beta-helix repeat-containing protein [Spirulina sp. SIO3F2]|nr:right-handed parallel beta-helix repeat-containing protein [Spirulina sp. SIO3F2]
MQMERRTFLLWLLGGGLSALFPSWVQGAWAQNSAEVQFYVATDGSDSWSGQLPQPNAQRTDGPFATLQRARDAIRALQRSQTEPWQQPIAVLLRGGTYYLDAPFVLEPEDSGTATAPITYRAFPGEQVLISGGQPISNWRPALDSPLWIADLTTQNVEYLDFRLLRIHKRQTLPARYPKSDPNNPITGGWLHAQWWGQPWEKGNLGETVELTAQGDRLEWQIDVSQRGNYHVWLRYKNPLDVAFHAILSSRDRSLQLNHLTPSPKLNWQHGGQLQLAAGTQTLSWEHQSTSTMELDAIFLTDDPQWQPDETIHFKTWWGIYDVDAPAPGYGLLQIQAEACDRAVGQVNVPIPMDIRGQYDRIVLKPEDFPTWQDWQDAEVHIFPAWGWVNTILKVQGVDTQQSLLRVDCLKDIRPGNRFFITNVKAALTEPGEWFCDRRSEEVFYWPQPGENPNQALMVAPQLKRLVVLQGEARSQQFVEHVRFEHLTFMDTDYTVFDDPTPEFRDYIRVGDPVPPGVTHPNIQSNGYYTPADAALWLSGAQHCRIAGCTFTQLGGYGVRLEQQSNQNEVVSNTITQMGQGGVVLLGDNQTQPHHNLIAGNDIHHCGTVYKHVAGVYLTTGSHNQIVHNRIAQMPRYGVSVKIYDEQNFSRGNVIEFNEIIATNLETNDTGAIEFYSGYVNETTVQQIESETLVRFNWIEDVLGVGTNAADQIIAPYLSCGIFLDGNASGVVMEGNVIRNPGLTGIQISNGRNNVVANNIMLNAQAYQLSFLQLDDVIRGNHFERNIIVFDPAQAILWRSVTSDWTTDVIAVSDHNLYWYGDASEQAITKTVITSVGSLAAWRSLGYDQNSVVADLQFLDITNRDLRLAETSPAWQLGFKAIPLEKIGRSGWR